MFCINTEGYLFRHPSPRAEGNYTSLVWSWQTQRNLIRKQWWHGWNTPTWPSAMRNVPGCALDLGNSFQLERWCLWLTVLGELQQVLGREEHSACQRDWGGYDVKLWWPHTTDLPSKGRVEVSGKSPALSGKSRLMIFFGQRYNIYSVYSPYFGRSRILSLKKKLVTGSRTSHLWTSWRLGKIGRSLWFSESFAYRAFFYATLVFPSIHFRMWFVSFRVR